MTSSVSPVRSLSAPPPHAASLPLALSMGDPAGIGLEIAIKAWQHRTSHGLAPFCIYASRDALAERAAALGLHVPLQPVAHMADVSRLFGTALPVRDIALAVPAVPGKPTSANAAATITAIELAVRDIQAGHARALVTNPIAKSVLYGAGFTHPGHTEFLAALAGQYWPAAAPYQAVMMLASDMLKVVPLTIHIPIASVPAAITRDLIAASVRITHHALQRDFAIAAPRLAIAGLNPHAGEGGAIGSEDRDVIGPAIAALAMSGYDVRGPLPADTMFHPAARAAYDAAICMYHDQALIPIKTLAFDAGVNVTLGLPFIRTSPDHGTAFDIAAMGSASPTSLIEALKLADSMAQRRAGQAAA